MRSYGWVLALLFMSTSALGDEPSVRLRAAGSLRAVMTEISQAFTASGGVRVEATFGASGLLREGIEKGDPTDVFASADVKNAQSICAVCNVHQRSVDSRAARFHTGSAAVTERNAWRREMV